ncbi:hypothetical protein TorRG33x02_005190, partial [Trema orientale]
MGGKISNLRENMPKILEHMVSHISLARPGEKHLAHEDASRLPFARETISCQIRTTHLGNEWILLSSKPLPLFSLLLAMMLSTSFVKLSTDFARPCSRSFSAIVALSHAYLRQQRFVSFCRNQLFLSSTWTYQNGGTFFFLFIFWGQI